MIYPRYLKVGFSIDNKPMISFIADDEINYKIYIYSETIKGFHPFWKSKLVRVEEGIYTKAEIFFPITDIRYPTQKEIVIESRSSIFIKILEGISFQYLTNDFEIDPDYFPQKKTPDTGS